VRGVIGVRVVGIVGVWSVLPELGVGETFFAQFFLLQIARPYGDFSKEDGIDHALTLELADDRDSKALSNRVSRAAPFLPI
jgi:hypothetical protein